VAYDFDAVVNALNAVQAGAVTRVNAAGRDALYLPP
jgi:hypothetical protein